MDLMESENFRKIRADVRLKSQRLYDALDATLAYADARQTETSVALYWQVALLVTDYITGRTK